nr:MAG TPA: hypothetical protein [Caudoviricetes sp.]
MVQNMLKLFYPQVNPIAVMVFLVCYVWHQPDCLKTI